jgi:murein DD-endopeptidase MepM/ murein hydrolase activator NlpD
MQVFWVSGPVGQIRSFNLSFKTVVVGFALLVVGLLAAGSVLQFMGFRMALEYDPMFARRLGNLHTALELENLNAVYHARLSELETEHRKLMQEVSKLESVKGRLKDFLPGQVAKGLPQGRGQGGAYLPAEAPMDTPAGSVLRRMEQFIDLKHKHRSHVSQDIAHWESTLAWLEGLPLGLPVQKDKASISSEFGPRTDPLTRQAALHTGLDFELAPGMPIVAAGSGVVLEAGWDGPYGHSVLIGHHDGYASRYAHASVLLVKAGDQVSRGQLIARSGNSGRSTGPHLHFEVLKDGKPVDPAPYLMALTHAR